MRQHELTGFTEIHMVGGETPHVDFDYYVDIVRSLHEALPDVHLKLFTASEIHHMTKLSGLTPRRGAARAARRSGSARCRAAAPRCSPTACAGSSRPGKEHPDFWFHTHDTAHRLGIPTHCTMLYGHVETYEERVDHLLRLREQQDKTGGFLAFIPLAFHPENTVFERRGWKHTTGSDDLKMIAVSRLMLDNIANIKAYWIMMGLPLAQVALHFGANDVQGTVVREQIFHAAGARTETEQKIPELVRFVARGGPDPRAARHALQRGGAMVRLGRISYVNMAPVFYRLDAEVEEIQGVPTELNRRVLAGELDVAPISSIEYARNADRLRLLPRLCVSSEGAVDSIQLVSRKPLEQVRTVAVTPGVGDLGRADEGAAARGLARAARRGGRREAPDRRRRARSRRSRIRRRTTTSAGSGSSARACRWCSPSGPAPSRCTPGLAELEDALVASVRAARAEPETLAYEASERYGYPAGFLARYFEKLRYRFGPRERAGLYTFLELAHEVGELDEVPELRFVREAVVA